LPRAYIQNHKVSGDTHCLQLLAHGWWFSPGTPASSTTEAGRHDIAEILPKVALSTKNKINLLCILFRN
jgi:hypothetical protein